MDDKTREALEEIQADLAALSRRADTSAFAMLAYLIDMARNEAVNQLKAGQK